MSRLQRKNRQQRAGKRARGEDVRRYEKMWEDVRRYKEISTFLAYFLSSSLSLSPPFLTPSLRHHFPSSPLSFFHKHSFFTMSPLPFLTITHRHLFASSPLPLLTTPFLTYFLCLHFPSWPLPLISPPLVTTSYRPLPLSTIPLRHQFLIDLFLFHLYHLLGKVLPFI